MANDIQRDRAYKVGVNDNVPGWLKIVCNALR